MDLKWEWVGVVGSRDYPALGFVETCVQDLGVRSPPVVLVTGTYPDMSPDGYKRDGVDERAARTAFACRMPVVIFPALWRGWDGRHAYSPHAGKARNSLIAGHIARLIAFWDGRSRGTADTIEKAQKMRIPVDIRDINGNKVT